MTTENRLERIRRQGTEAEITKQTMKRERAKKVMMPVKGIIDWCIQTQNLCSLLIDILPECFSTYDRKQRVCFICSFNDVCYKNTKTKI